MFSSHPGMTGQERDNGRPQKDGQVAETTQCAKCGACTSVCPVYRVTGRESLTARGRIHLLTRGAASNPSKTLAELFSKCLLCGACYDICPQGIDTPGLIIKARKEMPGPGGFSSFKKFLAQQSLASPALLNILSRAANYLAPLISNLPKASGLRLKLPNQGHKLSSRAPFLPNQQSTTGSQQSKILYYSGCMANYLEPSIGHASIRLLDKLCGLTGHAPLDQTCCGMAALAAGDPEQSMDLARKNIAAFSSPGLRDQPIFTSCATCYAQLKNYPQLLAKDRPWSARAEEFSQRVLEFSCFLNRHGHLAGAFTSSRPEKKVIYHDPCHLRFGQGRREPEARITSPPRELIRRLPGTVLLELAHGAQCCGFGGLFNISHPDLSEKIGSRMVDDFVTTEAEQVVTTCSGCLIQWRQLLDAAKVKAQVDHLALLLDKLLI